MEKRIAREGMMNEKQNKIANENYFSLTNITIVREKLR
jgi:hypothetical protein